MKTGWLRCDDEVLIELSILKVTEKLVEYLSPVNQLAKLQQFKDKYDQLMVAEQFCVKINVMKWLLPRLKTLSFKHHYAEMVNDTKPDIVAATAVFKKARRATKLQELLKQFSF